MTTTELGKFLGGYTAKQIVRFIEAGYIDAIRVPGTGNHYKITDDDAKKAKERFSIKATAFGKPKLAR